MYLHSNKYDYIDRRGRWEFFFEQGSRVSKVGPWVKKIVLQDGPKNKV